MDKIVLSRLTKRVNDIPCLAKSVIHRQIKDLVTIKELKMIQEYLQNDAFFDCFPTYNFLSSDEDSSESSDLDLMPIVPFCLFNSEEWYFNVKHRTMGIIVNGKRILGRNYLWGCIEIDNSEYCDFASLFHALLGTHLDSLRLNTKNILYEQWRTQKLLMID
jgi:septin family protein